MKYIKTLLFLTALLFASPVFGQVPGTNADSDAGAAVSLTWQDNSVSETGFIIERAPKPATGTAPVSSFVEIARVPQNVVAYVNTGLPQATAFTYRVCAYNGAGKSDYTGVVTVTTAVQPPPKAPTSLKGTPVVKPST